MKFGWKSILLVLFLVTLSAGVTAFILFSEKPFGFLPSFARSRSEASPVPTPDLEIEDKEVLSRFDTKEVQAGDGVIVIFPLTAAPAEGDPKPLYLFRTQGLQYKVEHRLNRLLAVGDNQLTISTSYDHSDETKVDLNLTPKTIFFRLTGDGDIMPLRPSAVNPTGHVGLGVEYDLITHKATGVSWVPLVYLTDDKESIKDISIFYGELVEVNLEAKRVTLSYVSEDTTKTKVLDISKTRLLNLPGQQ